MKIFERISKPTPKRNKLIGKIATGLGVVALTIAESGLIDNKPFLKIGIEVLSAKFGIVALYNAQKVVKDESI